MKLRNYQEYAISSVFDWFRKGNKGNPLIVAPTGTGKSVIIAGFIEQTLNQWRGQRILVLTHAKELIEQNHAKLKSYWPKAPAGIYSAGVGKKETHYPVTFAGIQSIHKAIDKFGHIDVVLVDEAHAIPLKEDTMYQKALAALRKRNPHIVVIGLSATPYRLGSGHIYGPGQLFTEPCCDMSDVDAFNWFLDEGYLAWLLPKPTSTELDPTEARTTGGDYNQGDLQELTDKEEITRECVREMIQVANEQNRNHWLIFATGVEHCNHIVDELERQGVRAAAVHSKMPAAERDANIARFQNGYITALVNMGVLTTGFDAPHIDMIGMLRCTKSVALWVQMLGRGTRPNYAQGYDLSTKEGRLDAIANSEKPNCIVLDFAANTERLGCINDPFVPDPKKKKKGGAAPVRICDGCGTKIHASLRKCPHCGHEYPPEVKFEADAGKSELIQRKKKKADQLLVGAFKVDQVYFAVQSSRNGTGDYIQVSYYCGLRRFTQPLCFNHPGQQAVGMARAWWRKACKDESMPETVEDAMAMINLGMLNTAKYIRVHVNCKPNPKILYVDYAGDLECECEMGERDVSL